MELEKVTVFYSIMNCGDGSAHPRWFLNEKFCDEHAEEEEWGEPCTGSVETFVGSDIYNNAVESDKEFEEDKAEEKEAMEIAKQRFEGATSCKTCGNYKTEPNSQGEYRYCMTYSWRLMTRLNPDEIDRNCPFNGSKK